MASSADIKKVQAAIGVTVDGVMGPKTRAALIEYQKSHGLTADGIIGPKTMAAVNGGGGAAPAAPAQDPASPEAINTQVMAAQYGSSLTFMQSDPELKSLFNDAVKYNYTTDEFTARLRSTNWFKNNSDAARSALVMQTTDPGKWNNVVALNKASIAQKAASMGANLDDATLNELAKNMSTFGWNDDTVDQQLNAHITMKDGVFYGQAGQYDAELRAYAMDNGLRIDDATMTKWVQQAVNAGSLDGQKQLIANMAASAFPSLADQIQAGHTVNDIASPYKQSMANILEVNSEALDAFDPTIRAAMAGVGPNGKPVTKSIWQFENDLRKDPRWKGTQNAQDSAMKTVHQVLGDMGLAF